MNRFTSLIVMTMLVLGAGCLRSAPAPAPEKPDELDTLPFESYSPSDEAPAETPDTLPTPVAQDAEQKVGERASASMNVIVSSLIEDQTLGNPFIILGRARAFENVVNWRVRDARNQILAQGNVMTNAQDMGWYGAFRVRAFFDKAPETETGFVDVYTLSPRDGAEQDMVSIPVRFETSKTAVKVFFSNIVEDPQTLYCERVYPVTRRIAKTSNIAEAAILELIKGPTAQERSTGSQTSVLPGTVLRSISITDDVATVDFSRDLVYALAGSCRVQALSAQINETLKQFPTIKVVKMLIEGEDAEPFFQP